MVIGYGIINLRLAECSSLKEKRGILNKIIKRTQNEFNVSVAQVGRLDDHKFAEIGFACVGNDTGYINKKVDHLLGFIDNMRIAETLNSKIEIMTISGWAEVNMANEIKYDDF